MNTNKKIELLKIWGRAGLISEEKALRAIKKIVSDNVFKSISSLKVWN